MCFPFPYLDFIFWTTAWLQVRNTGNGLPSSEAQLGNFGFSDSLTQKRNLGWTVWDFPLHSHLLTGKTYFIAAASLFRWNQHLTTGFMTEQCSNYKIAMVSIYTWEYFKHWLCAWIMIASKTGSLSPKIDMEFKKHNLMAFKIISLWGSLTHFLVCVHALTHAQTARLK